MAQQFIMRGIISLNYEEMEALLILPFQYFLCKSLVNPFHLRHLILCSRQRVARNFYK